MTTRMGEARGLAHPVTEKRLRAKFEPVGRKLSSFVVEKCKGKTSLISVTKTVVVLLSGALVLGPLRRVPAAEREQF